MTNRNPPTNLNRTCRVCGCTDDDCSACIARTGQPCSWVEHDLCSAHTGITWTKATYTELWVAALPCPTGTIVLNVSKNGTPLWLKNDIASTNYAHGYRARVEIVHEQPDHAGVPGDTYSAHFAGDTPEAARALAERWALQILARWSDQ